MPTLKMAVLDVLAAYAQKGVRQLQAEWQKAVKQFKNDAKKAADVIWTDNKWKEIAYPRVDLAFFKDKLREEEKSAVGTKTQEFLPSFIDDMVHHAKTDVPKDVDPKGTSTRAFTDPAMIKKINLDKIYDEYSKRIKTTNVPRAEILYKIVNKAIIEEEYNKMVKSFMAGGEDKTLSKDIPERRPVFASYDNKEAAYRVIKIYNANIG